MRTARTTGRTAARWLTVGIWLAAIQAADAEVVDRFGSGGWNTPNSKVPATLELEEGRLKLEDHPGGEVTWGSMAAKRFEGIDLRETRYLVIELTEATARFGVKLTGVGREGWPKKRVLRTTTRCAPR